MLKNEFLGKSIILYLYIFMKTKGQRSYFEFEIILNVLVCAFRFIGRPMLWVYGHYKYINYYCYTLPFCKFWIRPDKYLCLALPVAHGNTA